VLAAQGTAQGRRADGPSMSDPDTQKEANESLAKAIELADMRTHVSLGKDAPYTRAIERFGDVVAHPILGGLHHRYARI
jgi:hypothetical protein